jgi:competence protein ComEC
MLNKRPAFKALLFIAIIFMVLNLIEFRIFNISLVYLILIGLVLLILRNLKSVAYYSILFAIALILFFNLNNRTFNYPNKLIPNIDGVVEGVIKSKNIKSDKLTILDVEGKITNKVFRKIENETVRIYLFGESNNYNVGDEIFVNSSIRIPKKGNLTTDFSERQYLKTLGINFIALAKPQDIKLISKGNNKASFFEKLRDHIKSKIDSKFTNDVSPIIKAIILGDKTEIHPELKQAYSKTGTAHLLAVSGFHIGIIAFLIFTILGFIKNQWVKFAIFTLLLISFVILSGLQPSAIRAAAMAIIYLLLTITERKPDGINILSVVILFSVIINPNLINSISFQLSISAMFGIILFFKVFYNSLKLLFNDENIVIRYLLASFSITFSASLVTSLLVAIYFNIFSIIAPISNLFVIPFFSLGAFFSVIAVTLSYLSDFLASFYFISTEVFINIANRIILFISENPLYFFRDKLAILFSICIAIFTIYVFSSRTRNRLVFRLIVTSIAIIILSNLNIEKEKHLRLIPRNQFVAVEIIENDTSKYLIFDRKPSQYPFRDKSFEDYIISNSKSNVFIGITGNASIHLTDNLKEKIQISSAKLSLENEKIITKYFNRKHLVDLIKYD